jgi:hypothetical protein
VKSREIFQETAGGGGDEQVKSGDNLGFKSSKKERQKQGHRLDCNSDVCKHFGFFFALRVRFRLL